MRTNDDHQSERRATDSGAAGTDHEKQGTQHRCERAAPSVRAKPCAAHQRRACAICEELSLSDDASDYEPCGVIVPRVSCELPEGHAGDHMTPSDDLRTVARWPQAFNSIPLIWGGQGRDASEVADVRWVGVLLLVIVSGFAGAVLTAVLS